MQGNPIFAGFAALALFVAGCGGGDGEQGGTPPANDDAGSETSTGETGTDAGDAGGDAVTDADPDGGDADVDAGPKTKGVTATATVAGGHSMKSANYQLVTTVGQGPGGNVVMSSSTYELKAGMVGVTQP